MQSADLLIELGTEELPPKALLSLRDAFAGEFVRELDAAGFAHGKLETFATPRRLAFRLGGLQLQQPDREIEKRGPALAAAFDKDGNPSRAAQGFAQSVGLTVDQLQKLETDKGAWLVARVTEKGRHFSEVAQGFLEQAVQRLPIPKRMHWGSRRTLFVRPVHWLVALLDNQILPLTLLELESGRVTRGHRFHHPEPIELKSAGDYESVLEQQGRVLVSFEARRARIQQEALALGEQAGGKTRILPDLLDEVTALVEWPVPLVGHFEERFLRVPQEALIATMESNQKYFPVLDANGKLKNAFVFVSNIVSPHPEYIIAGNERVVRPRLSDAEFFFDKDSKKTLAQHAEPLARMVFQQQLGTLAEKAERVAALAGHIARQLQGDAALAEAAARLAKADLTTEMVGEFDNMQGIMGRYLALAEGLPGELAQALEEQYLPRFAGDALPATVTGQAVALADRLDTLVGIFSIGEKPTGDKDPFALRRAALGVLRIIIEKALPLDLGKLVDLATNEYFQRYRDSHVVLGESDDSDGDGHSDIMLANYWIKVKQGGEAAIAFVVGRYRSFYQEQGFATPLIQAVEAVRPQLPLDLDRRLKALAQFQQEPACAALAAANKRVANILAKQAEASGAVDSALLVEPAERALAQALAQLGEASGDYAVRLKALAALREPVDAFFEQVMVMADDAAVRDNRLRLLADLRRRFLAVADVSLLA